MDTLAIIGELRKELERIDGLILALEALQHGSKRGRPPKILQELRAGSATDGSAAVRRATSAVKKAAQKRKSRSSTRGPAT